MLSARFRLPLLGSLLLLAAPSALAGGRPPAPHPAVTVQLRNLARVDAALLEQATAETSWIFAKAGIPLAWVHCPAGDRELAAVAACREDGNPLVFRLGVLANAPAILRNSGLGFALVHSGGRNHAAVVYSRVAALAQSYPRIVDAYQVLAYAMAHEIAHLILGSSAHQPTGILRAGCGPGELQAVSQRRLLFRPAEIAALRQKLAERARGVELAGVPAAVPSPPAPR